MMTKLILLAILLSTITICNAQEIAPINLYGKEIPNSKKTPASYVEKNSKGWVTKVSIPTLLPYLPEKGLANGTAVIILPGGGYSGLATGYEGIDVAKEFAKIGICAFMLKYRLPNDTIMVDKTIGPLQDVHQAIKIIRKQAKSLGIKPYRIGIVGFSAGGHLASTAGTHFKKDLTPSIDSISVRPDFMVLIYPVITFGQFTHRGSVAKLLGQSPTAADLTSYSNEKQVDVSTPPTFLVQAGDDRIVSVQNSLLFYQSLIKANVNAELHIYPIGAHGFGLNLPNTKALWFDSLKNWMESNGWMKR